MTNPYAWQHEHPERLVDRHTIVREILESARRGLAVKVVGGRGMGKSVTLRAVADALGRDGRVCPVLVPAPPLEATLRGFVDDLASRVTPPCGHGCTLDALTEHVVQHGFDQLVILIDEADQYVLLDENGHLARLWFNHLESFRKARPGRVSVVVAGGLGLFHLAHVLGSGLVSRAESILLTPFTVQELQELAAPFDERGLPLSARALEVLAVLSGGIPALATFGLQSIWDGPELPEAGLRARFAEFGDRYPDFLRSVQGAVTQDGLARAPWLLLSMLRERGGPLTQAQVRDACDRDDARVDGVQALQLLQASGLARLHGSPRADPVDVHLVTSILAIEGRGPVVVGSVHQAAEDLSRIVSSFRRYGRDLFDGAKPLREETYSSLIAVALASRGWTDVTREGVQAGGYPDLRVALPPEGEGQHAIIEVKVRRDAEVPDACAQVRDYVLGNTRALFVVVLDAGLSPLLGERYATKVLSDPGWEAVADHPDLAGRWRRRDAAGNPSDPVEEHFLVRLQKRL